ncbi:MAG TPA: SAM-dependent methyltransferase, partial [Bradyrhizobium sp.]
MFILLRRYIRRGSITITTANGSTCTFGDGTGRPLAVRFTSAKAQRAVLLDPELKLGEAYMDGALVVERGSIADVLEVLLGQEPFFSPNWALPRLLRYVLRRLQQFNWRGRARHNVAHHYDLDGRL